MAALTGEDFVTSAKSAGVLVLTNLGLFSVVDTVSGFMFFTGILFSLGIPTIVGTIIIHYAVGV
jgi:hypothetical protein